MAKLKLHHKSGAGPVELPKTFHSHSLLRSCYNLLMRCFFPDDLARPANCVVTPIFITLLPPTLLSSHSSPEGLQRYYSSLCRAKTTSSVISLTNTASLHPLSLCAHIFSSLRAVVQFRSWIQTM